MFQARDVGVSASRSVSLSRHVFNDKSRVALQYVILLLLSLLLLSFFISRFCWFVFNSFYAFLGCDVWHEVSRR